MTDPTGSAAAPAGAGARLALLDASWRGEVAGAVRWLRERGVVGGPAPGEAPEVGLVLGSGLGNVVAALESPRACPFDAIPGFAAASVPGHSGRLVAGTAGGRRVVALQGRLHPYEGLPPARTQLPIAVLGCLGIRTAIVTNAAGGTNRFFNPGDLMVVRDHLDLHFRDPLRGLLVESLPPGAAAERRRRLWPIYHAELAARLRLAGARAGVPLHAGTYGSVWGPAYETRAEIGMLRRAGCDACGMSTAPETALLAALGVHVAGLTCITNPSRETGQPELSHREVVETGRLVEDKLAAVLLAFLPDCVL